MLEMLHVYFRQPIVAFIKILLRWELLFSVEVILSVKTCTIAIAIIDDRRNYKYVAKIPCVHLYIIKG